MTTEQILNQVVTEGEITKTVKAKIVTANINTEANVINYTAKRFYLEGETEIHLRTLYFEKQGTEIEEGDLQDILDANPIE